MAVTRLCTNTDVLGLEDYVEYVRRHVDASDDESVIESAPRLRALANNRRLLIDRFNRELLKHDSEAPSPYSQSSFVLAACHDEGFYVRGNIWALPSEDPLRRRHEERLFSYFYAHDHNFSFMTASWLGPGYETEIWEYDYASTRGEVGEQVRLEYLERVHFTTEKVMFYRRGRDVHIQYPPKALSVSLNLMLLRPEDHVRDQYVFDVASGTITGYPETMAASRRVSLIGLAQHLHDGETPHLLERLARTHGCRRTRIACLDTLRQIAPAETDRCLALAGRDRDPMVRAFGARLLQQLSQR